MKIKRKPVKGDWVDYKGNARLLIRPFPASEGIFAPTNTKELTDASWTRFNYCLQGWEGITEEDGEEFEYNDENKKFIFDYAQDLVFMVVTEARRMEQKIADELGE